MKLLLVNTSANSGSTGRIAEEIGQSAINNGYESYFAYGRICRESMSQLIKIGNDFDFKMHVIESRLLDNHGFASKSATKRFISDIKRIKPDIINLHNIHGYYLNIQILFDYLERARIPVVWTLHDCWAFTGHCSYFDRYSCFKWESECNNCPNKKGYPTSILLDRSKKNYYRKKDLFNKPECITFVTPSYWLEGHVSRSFLNKYPIITIHNGVDIEIFKPMDCQDVRHKLAINSDKKVILGVASTWDRRKGLDDFIELSKKFDDNYQIILVGLNDKQITALPKNIIGIKRTENIQQLAELYSIADVFVNPTYVDNFPTTNIEALACGTPVITYKTGGSPEAIDEKTGMVVEQGDIPQLIESIKTIANNKEQYTEACRIRALKYFNKNERFNDYVELFNRLTNK